MKTTTNALLCILVLHANLHAQEANWFPVREGIESKWAMQLDPQNLFNVYPRPTLQRKNWLNLNGLWEFSIRDKNEEKPDRYERHILVPFVPESKLSGVSIAVKPDDKIWYRREFTIPEGWSQKFIQLNFGASDYETEVYINGQKAGLHRGGYAPFTFDITYFLNERGKQTIEVGVWDPTDRHHQARGKQSLDPDGIWYTAVSGLWQTVWIEPVGSVRTTAMDVVTDIDASEVHFSLEGTNLATIDSISISVMDQENLVATGAYRYGDPMVLYIPKARLWTTEDPHLYNVMVRVTREDTVLDAFDTYFGMRKISIEQDAMGHPRIYLNNRPIFLLGVLDQGWWPSGLYTPPGIDAMHYDLDMVKSLGYNTIRKHVKVEPSIWYRACDERGLLVWQDIPNGDDRADWEPPSGREGVEIVRSFASEAQFKISTESIVQSLRNHPSIVYWCPFNEGWGQFKTVEITAWMREMDPTRIIGGPSGGNFFPVGDTRDIHKYPGPALPPFDGERALVLGEFGGLGYAVRGHLWEDAATWSYRPIEKRTVLTQTYTELIQSLVPLQKKGLCAAIYTQLTDVESEINGVMTYDRAVLKLNRRKVQQAHELLLQNYLSTP